jgi:LemA protein
MTWWPVVVLVVVVLVLAWVVLTYNRLVRTRNRVDNAWGQIDVQLTRRRDLVPNLVETVQGYVTHERGTLEAVTQARQVAATASSPAQVGAAEGALSQALGRLFAVAEAYPQLQANEGFRDLQAQLAETEDRIAVSRQVYNDTVLTYQNAIQVLPTSLVARPLGFTDREYLELDDAGRAVPEVRFDPPSA